MLLDCFGAFFGLGGFVFLFCFAIANREHYTFVSTGFTSVNPFRNIDSLYKKVTFSFKSGSFPYAGVLAYHLFITSHGKNKK